MKVKPLQWQYLATPPDGEYYAQGPFGPYFITRKFIAMNECVWNIKLYNYGVGPSHNTLEEAQSYAHDHALKAVKLLFKDWVIDDSRSD